MRGGLAPLSISIAMPTYAAFVTRYRGGRYSPARRRNALRASSSSPALPTFQTARWMRGNVIRSGRTRPAEAPTALSFATRSRRSPFLDARLFAMSAYDFAANEEDSKLLDPQDILREMNNLPNDEEPIIPMPSVLSPTSLEQFRKCPQAFFFLNVLKLAPDPPMTPALARGTLVHSALEELYDLHPEDRTLENLENLFRREWGRVRGDRESVDAVLAGDELKGGKNDYNVLFRKEGSDPSTGPYDVEAEIEWGRSSLDLLRNYCNLEDPISKRGPNPLMREMWVHAHFSSRGKDSMDDLDGAFIVRGKIDRIDVASNSSEDELRLRIIDYKTGKKPHMKYSKAVNERIRGEHFWKMKVYALMLWKMIRRTDENENLKRTERNDDEGRGEDGYKYGLSWVLKERLKWASGRRRYGDPRWGDFLSLDSLRLTYLTSHADDFSANDPSTEILNDHGIGRADHMDHRIGSPSEFEALLDETEAEVLDIVRDLKSVVEEQSPLAFKHCDWRYCSCHEIRRRFRPGSVYSDPELEY